MKEKSFKTINIFGSTGSIGIQSLNIIRTFKNKFKVVGLSCSNNITLLNSQIKEFKPEIVYIKDSSNLNKLDFKGKVFTGEDGIKEFANFKKVDISLISISGTDGIIPAYESINSSKLIALANKESIVSAGAFILEKAKKKKIKIIPVDSEHSAIFQCLQNQKKREVRKIILTASGGPFLNKSVKEFSFITPEMALKHPNWDMGNKITIDSATLMNKALEIIEAKWFFDLSSEKIDVIIHPQSIIHSMVKYQDGSIIAQISNPDMEIPISYALFYPYRAYLPEKDINLWEHKLEFYKPDYNKFPSLNFAYEALKLGKGYPAALNIANEIAVHKFLKREIKFNDIFKLIESVFKYNFPKNFNSLEDVFQINKEVKEIIK